MGNEALSHFQALSPNIHLIAIAFFGGFALFGLKFVEHFMRSEQDKMPALRYAVFFVGLLIALPVLGAAVTSIYLMNGDKLSPILALEVGLTSPAILQSLIIAAADNMAKNSSQTTKAGQ